MWPDREIDMPVELEIPVPNPIPTNQESDGDPVAVDQTIGTAMEGVIVSMAQGHAFVTEQGRISMLEGKVGMRESLSHRIIGESGGGQSRAHLPGGLGGVPTVVNPGA
jgi:hypothetical protein